MDEPTPPSGCRPRHVPACTFAAALALILLVHGGVCLAEAIPVGLCSFEFVDADGNADGPITVWYHRPESFRETDAIVIVMHGSRRNGQGHRDSWIEPAEGSPFLLLVPVFSGGHKQARPPTSWVINKFPDLGVLCAAVPTTTKRLQPLRSKLQPLGVIS